MRRKDLTGIALFVLAAVVVFYLPQLPWVSDFRAQQFAYVGIYFIALLGLNVLTGYTGQISLGHGAFMAIGWGLAAMLGALAGMLTAPTIFLDPNMMQAVLIYAFAAAVLGGIDSPFGAVAGGLMLGVGLNLIGTYVDFVGAGLRLPVALLIILVVLLVKPAGLFGKPITRRV